MSAIPGTQLPTKGFIHPTAKGGAVNVKPAREQCLCARAWRRHADSLANTHVEHSWSRAVSVEITQATSQIWGSWAPCFCPLSSLTSYTEPLLSTLTTHRDECLWKSQNQSLWRSYSDNLSGRASLLDHFHQKRHAVRGGGEQGRVTSAGGWAPL